jgi:hypothetical protein
MSVVVFCNSTAAGASSLGGKVGELAVAAIKSK